MLIDICNNIICNIVVISMIPSTSSMMSTSTTGIYIFVLNSWMLIIFYVGTITTSTSSSSTEQTSEPTSEPSGGGIGPIIGGVVGAIIIAIVIIVIVVVVIIIMMRWL